MADSPARRIDEQKRPKKRGKLNEPPSTVPVVSQALLAGCSSWPHACPRSWTATQFPNSTRRRRRRRPSRASPAKLSTASGVAADDHAAGGAPTCSSSDRRRRLRLQQRVRRCRRPHAAQACATWPPLHPDAQYGALLADPRGAADRPQPLQAGFAQWRKQRPAIPATTSSPGPKWRMALWRSRRRRLHRVVRQERQCAGPGGEPAGPLTHFPIGQGYDYF